MPRMRPPRPPRLVREAGCWSTYSLTMPAGYTILAAAKGRYLSYYAGAHQVQVSQADLDVSLDGAPAQAVDEGVPINLGSSLVNNTGQTPIYSWTVTRSGQTIAPAGPPDLSFTPDDAGQYAVTLTVPAGSLTASDSATITVSEVGP